MPTSIRRVLIQVTVAAVVLAALAAFLVGSAGRSHACVCDGIAPREALGQTEFAFTGRPTAVRDRDDGHGQIWTFTISEVIRGPQLTTADVSTDNSSCGVSFENVNREVGIVTRGSLASLSVGQCGGVWDPGVLLMARDLPLDISGSGAVAALMPAVIGDARVVALNRAGRPVAYGLGDGVGGQLAVCPGNTRSVETNRTSDQFRVRDLRSLEVVESHPIGLDPRQYSWGFDQAFACLAEDASVLVTEFLTWEQDQSEDGTLAVWTNGTVKHIAVGSARSATIDAASGTAYLLAGPSGTELVRVDLAGGDTTVISEVPGIAAAWEVAISLDGDNLAITGSSQTPPEWYGGAVDRLLITDLEGNAVHEFDFPVAENAAGLTWLSESVVVVRIDMSESGHHLIVDTSTGERVELGYEDGVHAILGSTGESILYYDGTGLMAAPIANPSVGTGVIESLAHPQLAVPVFDGPVIEPGTIAAAPSTTSAVAATVPGLAASTEERTPSPAIVLVLVGALVTAAFLLRRWANGARSSS